MLISGIEVNSIEISMHVVWQLSNICVVVYLATRLSRSDEYKACADIIVSSNTNKVF